MAKVSPTRIHVKLDDKTEAFELYPGSSNDDVRAILYSLASLSLDDKDVVFKLTKPDGTVVPPSPLLPGNTEKDPYVLSVKRATASPKDTNAQIASKLAPLELKLNDIAKQLEPLRDISAFREQLVSFQKRVEVAEKNLTMSQFPATKVTSKTIKRISKIDPIFTHQPKYVFTDETVAYLKQPSFNNWQWEENEMVALIEHMFSELGLIERFKIELPLLKRFLHTVKDNYNNNPFHNFRHCFCVTQMFYGIVNVTKIMDKVEPIDLLIGLVACIIHDIDHPGFNNAYQVNARTELATVYNDQSPLENHHCAVGFTIIRNKDCNIFKNLTDKEYDAARKGIVRCVLSTDLTKHGDIMAKFKVVADNFSFTDPEHRMQLLVMMVKCADISNEARPADVAEPWLDCLLEEYFAQSDREKAEGLPVAPFMDRDKVTKPGAQVGFIQFVMIPLFEHLARVLPQLEGDVIPQIRKSLAYYQELQQKMQKPM
ncbi:3',5'-cyclic-nucleotide phosphodiesterase [Blastocladiella emersonii ATCC 22665]|uniref:Phosphodiesterase n=1 Tax=Blastocladiella emersonii TaxID=4808 RepID=C6GAL0_BLAEM|nr:cGMP phosphodiesterase [Blastocladiella emersonii]KAI9189950.1 3',5'-cyclic-nucleotide phosphodiesterase [Blastocladiella emersonii ATCC 22665]